MREDEFALVVCSPATAEKLKAEEPNVIDSCVIWSRIPDDTAFVVSKEEFINWLAENDIDDEEGEE